MKKLLERIFYIKHPKSGVDIIDLDFEKKLIAQSLSILSNQKNVKKQLIKAQNKLWDISKSNSPMLETLFLERNL